MKRVRFFTSVKSLITENCHACVFCSGATQIPHHATLEKQRLCIPSHPSFFEQPFRLSAFFFKTPNSSVSFRRGRTRIYTLIELLMRKSYKNDVSFRRCQFAPCLIFPFFLPCFRFDILTSQGENTNFHPDRAPHRDSDHRDSGGDAAACA